MNWSYYNEDEKEIGPFSEKEIASLIARGEINAETLVHRDGFDAWYPLHTTELAQLLSSTALVHEADTTSRAGESEDLGQKLKAGAQSKSPDNQLPPPFQAYSGREPYVFISYAHKDSAAVFQLISRLHADGFRIWYDEGIDPGNEWPEEIAKALGGCSLFLLIVTPRSVASVNCRNEINFALNKGKPFLSVYLEETELPDGLALRMGDLQAVMMHRLKREMAYPKLTRAIEKNVTSGLLDEKERQEREETAQNIAKQANPPKKADEAKKKLPLVIGAFILVLVIVALAGLVSNAGENNPSEKTEKLHESSEKEPASLETQPSPTPKNEPVSSPISKISEIANASKIDVALPGDLTLKLIRIAPGSFVAGSPVGEIGRAQILEDQRGAQVEKPFFIGVTEITRGQYRAIMGADSSFHQGSMDLPVEQIAFPRLTGPGGFLEKLTEHIQSIGYIDWVAALPTNDEWEYAARAGTTTTFYNGQDIMGRTIDPALSAIAVYANTAKSTLPVGSKNPNPWGLYDVLGNVFEWTAEGDLRGGSYNAPASANRPAFKLTGFSWRQTAGNNFREYGIRVVLRPPEQ